MNECINQLMLQQGLENITNTMHSALMALRTRRVQFKGHSFRRADTMHEEVIKTLRAPAAHRVMSL